MLDISEMSQAEIHGFLKESDYGHLGYIHEGTPFVMPMHYYLEDSDIYLFTTEGMKTHDIDKHPEICLQVEAIRDDEHWCSVIVIGRAEHLTQQPEIDRAMQLVKSHNPKLSPALNRTWVDSWGRASIIVIYRIHPIELTGRTTEMRRE